MKKIQYKTIIQPSQKFGLNDIKEIIKFRELFFTLVEKDFKVRYKQTVFGALWAILQPLTTMILFSFFFGKIAKIPSDGVPYPIFSYSGILLWTYFSSSIALSSSSLLSNSGLISKVYFPRLIIPLSSTIVGLIDYFIASLIIIGLIFFYKFTPNINIIFIPFILFFTWMLASGVGFWLSATNVLFRDIKFLTNFLLSLWIYATPVIYPLSVAGQFKWIVILNPMSGLIEAHRAMILGHQVINWGSLLFSVIFTIIIFISGLFYFKKIEQKFADII